MAASTRPCTTPSSRPDTTVRSMTSRGTAQPISPGGACGGRVTVDGSSIAIEPGYRLDLGGIAKGYAADRVCALLASSGPCLVNVGGDLASHGTPEQGVWPVAVEVPGTPLDPRAPERSPRDIGARSPPLAARRGRASPSHRSGDRAADGYVTRPRDGVRPKRSRRRGVGESASARRRACGAARG